MTSLFKGKDPEDGNCNVEAAGETDELVEQHLDPDMVIISDGNSEIGTHVQSEISYSNCLRPLFRSTSAVTISYKYHESRRRDLEGYVRLRSPTCRGLPRVD